MEVFQGVVRAWPWTKQAKYGAAVTGRTIHHDMSHPSGSYKGPGPWKEHGLLDKNIDSYAQATKQQPQTSLIYKMDQKQCLFISAAGTVTRMNCTFVPFYFCCWSGSQNELHVCASEMRRGCPSFAWCCG
eukprot:1150810-Pelagomonas_calceolata.AAC.2